MKTFPVTIAYDGRQVIGTISLDETRLPPNMIDYVFGIAGKIISKDAYGKITAFELTEVSLLADSAYQKTADGIPLPMETAK